MSYNNKKISVIMPCLNEEEGLDHVFKLMPLFVDETIVVDNGSTDNSIGVAKNHNAKIFNESRRGYGASILRGLREVTGDIIVILDGDGTYPVTEIEKICTFLETGPYDFINGCRFPLVDNRVMPLINKFSNYFISWLIERIFKVHIKDTQSGFMVFRKTAVDKLNISNKDMDFSQEIKIKAWLDEKIRCAEVHIPYGMRIGKSKYKRIKDGFKTAYDLFVIKQNFQKPAKRSGQGI